MENTVRKNRRVEDSGFYKLITGGDDSKGYRIITWTYLPFMIISSILGSLLLVLTFGWMDLNITAFPLHERLMISSALIFVLVFVFESGVLIIGWTTTKETRKLDEGSHEKNILEGMRKVRGQFAIWSTILIVIVIILAVYPSIHGYTNYKTNLYIYIHTERDDYLINRSVDSDVIELRGITTVRGDVRISDTLIRNYPNRLDYGIIVEGDSSLELNNVTIDGSMYRGIVFEVKGSIHAINSTFINIHSEQLSEIGSGIKIYDGGKRTSGFENCTFEEFKGNAILAQGGNLYLEDCNFNHIGLNSVRGHVVNLTVKGCRFIDSQRGVSAYRSLVSISNSSFSDLDEGIYLEQSEGKIRECDFQNISSRTVEYYGDRPVVEDCDYDEADPEIREKKVIPMQLICFLVLPGIIVIISVFYLIVIYVVNGKAERRTRKQLKRGSI